MEGSSAVRTCESITGSNLKGKLLLEILALPILTKASGSQDLYRGLYFFFRQFHLGNIDSHY
ncbi:hypothetical protein SBDP1_470022 [Syntrophobacter sp. SbD1]|nr:hypothetical protein SBDP1_470022 [Syntrophobacter sp. SbD1]